jgi:RNA recognition motif-containing protein
MCVVQVVVHGLPWRYAWQDLSDLMRTVGQVVHTDIVKDPSGRSKGYGTAQFATPADAMHAIQARHHPGFPPYALPLRFWLP